MGAHAPLDTAKGESQHLAGRGKERWCADWILAAGLQALATRLSLAHRGASLQLPTTFPSLDRLDLVHADMQ